MQWRNHFNMKHAIAKIISIVSIVILLPIIGCTTTNNNTQIPEKQPLSSFNDESYIWENWCFGTNEVDRVY